MAGFRKFLFRGNLIDLAVAVVIGVAFNAVVQARDCPECLSSIPVAAKRCMYCTSEVPPVGQQPTPTVPAD